jgi:hypothetical protein
MSTTTADTTTDTTTGCPSWCQDHPETDSTTVEHRAVFPVGSARLEVTRDDDGPVRIFLPDVETYSPDDLRPLAAALTGAADELEGVGPDELLCERCAPHADEAFQAGRRAGQRVDGHPA